MTIETAAPELLAAARDIQPDVVAIRRRLHRQPEIGLDLPRTQAVIAEELERLGLAARPGTVLTSLRATIGGARPGPTALLRADMDALPLREDTGLEFASELDGAMHACGHDTHVAMLLGAARLLLERRDRLAGRVELMFQPGEEGNGGAPLMIGEGLLDGLDPNTTTAFAIHISTRYPANTIDLRAGAMLAAADTLRIRVRGRGGHASTPHLAVDPIFVAAQIVNGLQGIVGRRVDVFDPAVITIAHVTAGTTTNIIPEEALLEGTIRTVSETSRDGVHAAIRELVPGLAAAFGASAEADIERGYPVTINDPTVTAMVRDEAVALVGEDAVEDLAAPIMGAEDFSFILQRVPGVMAFLGAQPPGTDPATAPQNHSNVVVFDEDSMALGVALHAAVAMRLLGTE